MLLWKSKRFVMNLFLVILSFIFAILIFWTPLDAECCRCCARCNEAGTCTIVQRIPGQGCAATCYPAAECGTVPCGNDECQVDSDCGPGCRCLYDPGGNYCYCSSPTTPPPPPNRPPTCTINGPTNITYDAQKYWDANKTPRTQNPTEHRLNLTLSDPDGDAVSVTNVTVDRNCLTSRRAGNDVYVTPQGQVTGVTPALTGTNSCDVQVDSGQ